MLNVPENDHPWTATIEIEGSSYGTMYLKGDFRRGEWITPSGAAWFCPWCARVWARVSLPDRPHTVWTTGCQACGAVHSLEVGGSIWQVWDKDFNNALPIQVLAREFALHLKHWEKENE